MKKIKWAVGSLVVTASLLSACSGNNGMQGMDHSKMNHGNMGEKNQTEAMAGSMNHGTEPKEFNANAMNGLLTMNTKNVTRLDTNDPVKMAVMVSQTIWPATHKENQPGGVILVPIGSWQTDIASADLIHHPNNGPILFINKDSIPNLTLEEIKRLQPLGVKDGTQVMVMGDVSKAVLDALQAYKVKQIKGADDAAFAKEVDKVYAEAAGGYPESVIVGSSDEEARLFTTPAVNWISHMPEPLLYVKKNEVPQATIDALKERKGKANIYLLGPESIVSADVEKKLGAYGKVTRISGKDPVENAIAFARFKDKKTKFGWGLTNPGHGVSFTSTKTPDLAIAGAPFSHMGKHAPLLFLENGEPTQPVYDFLGSIKPMYKESPTEGPYNHAFLLGTNQDIPFRSQGIIDDKLEIMSSSGMDHGNMNHGK